MAQAQSKSSEKVALGAAIELPEGGEIQRPDGSRVTVTGGSYIADVAGTYTVGDREYVAK